MCYDGDVCRCAGRGLAQGLSGGCWDPVTSLPCTLRRVEMGYDANRVMQARFEVRKSLASSKAGKA